MTSENPLGEVLELVPKSSEPWRSSSFPSRPSDGARAADARAPAVGRPAVEAGAAVRPGATPTGQPPAEARPAPVAVESPARVLTPARVASWRSSSFDLLSGLTVRDVSDTIPGDVFDEIFRAPQPAGRRPAPKPR